MKKNLASIKYNLYPQREIRPKLYKKQTKKILASIKYISLSMESKSKKNKT